MTPLHGPPAELDETLLPAIVENDTGDDGDAARAPKPKAAKKKAPPPGKRCHVRGARHRPIAGAVQRSA